LVLEQADLKRKKQIAKEHAHENIKFVKSVVEQHMKLDIQETWDALAELRQERNLIAHGVWSLRFGGDAPSETAVPPTGLPMVLWHSKMLESDDYVTAESFDYWRFDKFMQRARLLLNTFRQFKAMCHKAIYDRPRARLSPFARLVRLLCELEPVLGQAQPERLIDGLQRPTNRRKAP
jgi:hypothetical protein